MSASAIVVISGNSNLELANLISKQLGKPLTETRIGKFANGETRVDIKESVRNKDVYIIQSGYGSQGTNDSCMEMYIIIVSLVCVGFVSRSDG